MTKQTKTYVVVMVGLVVLLGIIWLGAVRQQEQTSLVEPITIGFIGPLSGDVAVFGEVGRQAIEVAVEEINASGGAGGREIRVLYEHGECTGRGGAGAAQKLINVDQVKILFVLCSAENIAIGPIAEQHGVLQIAAWSNHPDVTQLKIFRLSHSDSVTARMTAEHIYAAGERVGVLYELTDYPVGLKDEFVRRFESLGGMVVQESVEMNAVDAKTQLTKILSQKPDAIWLDPNSPNLGVIMLKQLRELGYDGPLYGNFFRGK